MVPLRRDVLPVGPGFRAKLGGTKVIVLVAAFAVLLFFGATVVLVLHSPPPPTAVGTWGWEPCATDRDCRGGSICRTHIRPRFGPIRACRFMGPRGEGERCGAPPQT